MLLAIRHWALGHLRSRIVSNIGYCLQIVAAPETQTQGCIGNIVTCEWPCLTSRHAYSWPGSHSQIQTDLSLLHVANSVPLGLHATPLTSFSWPSRMATFSKSKPCIAAGLNFHCIEEVYTWSNGKPLEHSCGLNIKVDISWDAMKEILGAQL